MSRREALYPMTKAVAEAMKTRREELIARPLAGIWPELASAAIAAMPANTHSLPWIKITSADDLPKKPGKRAYEQIDCLVIIRGEVEHCVWNCEHLVWDDSSGDDYRHDAMTPSYYLAITLPPTPPEESNG